MRRLSILTATLLIICGMVSQPAHAATGCSPETSVCVGQPCDGTEIGKSIIDYDKNNIIACLKDSSGSYPYIWKSMTAVNQSCPNGQLVSGYKNGTPICSGMQCHVVLAKGAPPNYAPTASCPDDEFVLNGGGYTHFSECGYQGFLHASVPAPEKNGWAVDAWGANTSWGDHSKEEVCSSALVTCCKWVAQ